MPYVRIEDLGEGAVSEKLFVNLIFSFKMPFEIRNNTKKY
jgi:hypothetical protein